MKKSLVLFFAILWSTSVSAGEDKTKALDGFNNVDFGHLLQGNQSELITDTLLGFVNTRVGGFGVVLEEGRPVLEVKISFIDARGDNERGVVDVKETGFADDSVKGEWQRYLFKRTKDRRFKLVGYGLKYMCYRGENKDKWIKDRCG